MLGIACAGIGRFADAIREGTKAVELYPVSDDAFAGTSWRSNLVQIYAMTGESALAAQEIQYLFSVPSQFTPIIIHHNQVFDDMRARIDIKALPDVGRRI